MALSEQTLDQAVQTLEVSEQTLEALEQTLEVLEQTVHTLFHQEDQQRQSSLSTHTPSWDISHSKHPVENAKGPL